MTRVISVMLFGIFLLLSFISVVNSGFCSQSYSCERTCYKASTYYVKCGLFGWSRCARYKTVSEICTTCTKEVCCPGYTGDDCETPLCYGSTSCPNNGHCSSPDYCDCKPGYVSPNCSALCYGSKICPNNGTCVAPDSCLCQTGFSLPNCSDIDECATNTSDCQQVCLNTLGSYQCSCHSGFVLTSNGSSCDDVDECEEDNGGCEHTCTNEIGSYRCSCNDGHVLHTDNSSCTDINECEIDNGGCEHLCNNLHGLYNCSCRNGYVLQNDSKSCADINECEEDDNGGCEHFCRNTEGSFSCHCSSGFELHNDTASCLDINECDTENGGCDHICKNTLGSFQCTCFKTFDLKGDHTSCTCKDGFSLNTDNSSCIDDNECEHRNGGCDQMCTNGEGSFACSCRNGYNLQNDGKSCEDVNECKVENGGCDQICANNDGSFSCSCHDGYVLHSDGQSCIDINECDSNNGGCQQQCVNTRGSFFCSCGIHFALKEDKVSCESIKERSLSASVKISFDLNENDFPEIISRETDVFQQIKESIYMHFKNYTDSYFKIIINKISKYTSPKERTKLTLTIKYTIIYEKGEKSNNIRDQLLQGNLRLRHGATFLFQGQPVKAMLQLPESVSSDCDAYILLSGGCEEGFRCTESNSGPTCMYISLPQEEVEEKYIVYIVPVVAFIIIIVISVLVVGYIKKKKIPIGTWSVKYKRHFSNIEHCEAVENVYQNDVTSQQTSASVKSGHGSKHEYQADNKWEKPKIATKAFEETHQISSGSVAKSEASYGST